MYSGNENTSNDLLEDSLNNVGIGNVNSVYSNVIKQNNLKILHLNLQYLREQIDMLVTFLKIEQPDLKVLSEHGLKKEELLSINFQQYDVVCEFSRSEHKSSGRLVILSNRGMNVNIFCREMVFELAGIEIKLRNNEKLILFGIYRPPHYSNVDSFFSLFYQLLSNFLLKVNKLCLIVGDLNLNWLKNNAETNRLKDLMKGSRRAL